MFRRYLFSDDQLETIKRAQGAFNASTGHSYTIYEYIAFVMQQTVANEFSGADAIEVINDDRNSQIKLKGLLGNGAEKRASYVANI